MNRLRQKQRGVAAVEVAIVGAAMFGALFAVIEVGRFLWYLEALNEATRRAARAAVVCPPFGEASNVPGRFAVMKDANDNGVSLLPELDDGDISVLYLDENMQLLPKLVAVPPLPLDCTDFGTIRYARVSIPTPGGFAYDLALPLINPGDAGGIGMDSLPTSAITTTLPAESLGFVPGSIDLQCFGVVNAIGDRCP